MITSDHMKIGFDLVVREVKELENRLGSVEELESKIKRQKATIRVLENKIKLLEAPDATEL